METISPMTQGLLKRIFKRQIQEWCLQEIRDRRNKFKSRKTSTIWYHNRKCRCQWCILRAQCSFLKWTRCKWCHKCNSQWILMITKHRLLLFNNRFLLWPKWINWINNLWLFRLKQTCTKASSKLQLNHQFKSQKWLQCKTFLLSKINLRKKIVSKLLHKSMVVRKAKKRNPIHQSEKILRYMKKQAESKTMILSWDRQDLERWLIPNLL